MKKVSIIIPVFNREKYIYRCIYSVINQTYKDLEIIIVDDGSTDDSLNIIKSFDDSRLKIIESENKGVSSARNIGLNNSSGKYIMFVDSDDYILEDMVENFVFELEKNNVDLVCGNFSRTKEKIINKTIVLSSDFCAQQYIVEYYKICPYNCPVAKLYVKDKINMLFNEYLMKSEDTVFNINYLKNVKSIAIIPNYSYVANDDNHPSLTKTYKFGEFKMFIEAQKELANFLRNSPYKMNNEMNNRVFNNAKSSIILCLKSSYSFNEKKEEIVEIINNEILQEEIYLLSDLSILNKIIVFLMKKRLIWLIIIIFSFVS